MTNITRSLLDAVRAQPDAVIEPESDADVAAVLALCSDEGWLVQPAGAGTWLTSEDATPAATPRIRISTRRITGIEDYQPEDLTVTVAAGTTHADLQLALRANNQCLALDPPALTDATIGATIATASAGPLRARYGTPRDQVLGLDIATGDGRLLHFGGKVVKNVAGYDIVRPIVGSRGTLGIITRVSLRLRALHAAEATIAFAVHRDEAPAVAAALHDAWPVAALEILSPWLATEVLGATAAHPEWTILARIHGHPAEVAEARDRLNRTATGCTSSEFDKVVWSRLCQMEAGATAYGRLAARPTRITDLMIIANTLADHTLAGPSRTAIHATAGILRLWGDPSTEPRKGFDDALNQAAASLLTIDGTISWNGKYPTPPDRRRIQIEQGIRAVFDPAGILP